MRLTAFAAFTAARNGHNQSYLANLCNCDPDIVSRAILEDQAIGSAWRRGLAAREKALRDLQWKHARRADGSGVTMTIHMSKHLLGEHDKSLAVHKHEGEINVLHQLLKEIDGQTRGLPDYAGLEPEHSELPRADAGNVVIVEAGDRAVEVFPPNPEPQRMRTLLPDPAQIPGDENRA